MNRYLRLFCVFATLHVTVQGVSTNGPKSVNLALETQVVFEPQDSYKNMRFIQMARSFLDKLEEAITPHNKSALRTNEVDTKKPLTTFLYDAAQVILDFHEEEIETFLKVLEAEMKSQFYKGSIFREIVYDTKLQLYTRNKLKEWANTDPRKMKAKLRKYITTDMYQNNTFNNLGSFLNVFYGPEQEEKMKEILERLKESQDEKEMTNTVRDALDTLVFQHYDRMNYTSRTMLAKEINKLINYFTDSAGYAGDSKSFRKFIAVMAARDILAKAGVNEDFIKIDENKNDLDTSRINEEDWSKDDTSKDDTSKDDTSKDDTSKDDTTKDDTELFNESKKGDLELLKLIDNGDFIKDYDFLSTTGPKEFTLDGYEYLNDEKKNSTKVSTEVLDEIDNKDSTKNNSEIIYKANNKETSANKGIHISFNKLIKKGTPEGDSGVFSKIGKDSNVHVILNKDVEISVKAFGASSENNVKSDDAEKKPKF